MRRSISSFALLFASVSAILGSGWLFTNYYAAQMAGPAAILAWIIGGLGILVVAFVFAELCSMLPITGSSTRIPQFTHGTLACFLFSWVIWLSYASLVPTEVQAVMQYLSYYFPLLLKANGGLSGSGYIWAAVLMLLISVLNIFSLRWLLRCNNFLTVLKIIIPVLLSGVIIFHFFSPDKVLHPGHSEFMPFGWHGVLAAVSTGGIVFAFNGFKQACEMAGEAKQPSRALPFAIIGSVVGCLLVYLLLETSLLTSLTSQNLADGWKHIALPGENSPFAAILKQNKLSGWLPLLYVGAVVGPLAAALMYAGSASRSMYGMSKNKHISKIFHYLTPDGNPVYAICANFVFGMCLFAPLPGWEKMITFLTSLMAVTYSIGPVCLIALREQLPDLKRPFKLPFGRLWATIAFFICAQMTYWGGWNILSKVSIALIIGICVLFTHRWMMPAKERFPLNWRSSIWVWPYFTGMTLISYLGNFGGGLGVIPFGWDFAVIALFCIGIIELAARFKLPARETAKYIEQLNLVKKA